MTENGELDPTITKFVIDEFDTLLQEQQVFQNMLQVDFSKVINYYNDYIFNDTDDWIDSILDSAVPYNSNNEVVDLEELDDLEDLEDLEEL